jgi:hypothetical protein
VIIDTIQSVNVVVLLRFTVQPKERADLNKYFRFKEAGKAHFYVQAKAKVYFFFVDPPII